MRKFFKDFKAFITKGNVFDMAVGLIIATAFNKIVSSMVNDIIMPLVTYATGAASLQDLSIVLRYVETEEGLVPSLTWNYGNFIQTVLDFLIIAFSVFIMVKIVVNSREKFKSLTELIAKESKKERKAERKMIKAKAKQEGRKFKEVWAEHLAEKERLSQEKAKLEAEEKARKEAEEKLLHPSQEVLLMEIRDLLKEQNKNN